MEDKKAKKMEKSRTLNLKLMNDDEINEDEEE